jgi:drug/metabolite transporter (DMT)-like permease
MLMARHLGRVATTASLSIYTALAFAVLSAIAVSFVWVTPTLEDVVVMSTVGLMAGFAQYAMTAAFRMAPASVLAPFEYTGIVWGVILGFVIWDEWPSRDVAIGATIIIFAGLYIVHRERLAARRMAATP